MPGLLKILVELLCRLRSGSSTASSSRRGWQCVRLKMQPCMGCWQAKRSVATGDSPHTQVDNNASTVDADVHAVPFYLSLCRMEKQATFDMRLVVCEWQRSQQTRRCSQFICEVRRLQMSCMQAQKLFLKKLFNLQTRSKAGNFGRRRALLT